MCRVYFGDDDILIDRFRLNPVHMMNEPFEPDAEFDFYMDTGKDCYLLRLRNNSKNTIALCKHAANDYDFIYIVVEKPLNLSIHEELALIVSKLKVIEIPPKIHREIVFAVFD